MSPNKIINVLIVGNLSILRNSLKVLLESTGQYRVVGEADDLVGAAEIIDRQKPDVLLLDLDEDRSDAFVGEFPAQLPALVLTGSTDPQIYQKCLRAGANGLVSKHKDAKTLFKAIEKVCQGEFWFDRAQMGLMIKQLIDERNMLAEYAKFHQLPALTERERQVLTLICKGKKNKSIADDLFITETTVRHHLTSIFEKFEITNRLELVIYAFKNNLVKIPAKTESPAQTL